MIIWNAQDFKENDKDYTRHVAHCPPLTLVVAPVTNNQDPAKAHEVVGYVYRIAGLDTPTQWLGSSPTAEDAKREVMNVLVGILGSITANLDVEMIDTILANQRRWLIEGKRAGETARAVTKTAVNDRIAEVAKALDVDPDKLAGVMGIKFPEDAPKEGPECMPAK